MQIIKRLIFTSSYLLLARNFLSPIISFATELTANAGNQVCNIPFVAPSRNFNSNKFHKNNEMSESYCPGSTSVAFVTTPDEKFAKKLAHAIIQQKLAACVNIIPQIQSIYMWEGKVNEDNEYLLMIKTRSSRIDELSKYVRENHPYSVAEVISLPIENGNLPYLNWITQTVPEKK